MKLGIMVTTEQQLDRVRGITGAALRTGHTVSIFATGEGTKLLADRRFAELAALAGVALSYCGHSARLHAVRPAALPEAVAPGSQFENAIMATESDKVIIL